jgi:hypothetical protein
MEPIAHKACIGDVTRVLALLPGSPMSVLIKVVGQAPTRPSQIVPVPAGLEAICLRCLEKDSGQRYASATALALDLERFLAGARLKEKNR